MTDCKSKFNFIMALVMLVLASLTVINISQVLQMKETECLIINSNITTYPYIDEDTDGYLAEFIVQYWIYFDVLQTDYNYDCEDDMNNCEELLRKYEIQKRYRCYYNSKNTDIIEFEKPKIKYELWLALLLSAVITLAVNKIY